MGVFNQRRDEKRGRGVVTECNKETGNLVLVQFQLMYGEPSNGGREGTEDFVCFVRYFSASTSSSRSSFSSVVGRFDEVR